MDQSTYLRETAQMMRRAAESATPGPWRPWDGWGPTSDGLMGFSRFGPESGERVLHHDDMRDIYATRADAEHLALWHPGVALTVADLLECWADLASVDESVLDGTASGSRLLAVARAWRGEE